MSNISIDPESITVTKNTKSVTIRVPGVISLRVEANRTNDGAKIVNVTQTILSDEPTPEYNYVGVVFLNEFAKIPSRTKAYLMGLYSNERNHEKVWYYRTPDDIAIGDVVTPTTGTGVHRRAIVVQLTVQDPAKSFGYVCDAKKVS